MNTKENEFYTPPVPNNYCCVTQCRNYMNPYAKIDLTPLPEKSEAREKFCQILGIRPDVGQQPTARVCALHFKSKQPKPISQNPKYTPTGTIATATNTTGCDVYLDNGRCLKRVVPTIPVNNFAPSQVMLPSNVVLNTCVSSSPQPQQQFNIATSSDETISDITEQNFLLSAYPNTVFSDPEVQQNDMETDPPKSEILNPILLQAVTGSANIQTSSSVTCGIGNPSQSIMLGESFVGSIPVTNVTSSSHSTSGTSSSFGTIPISSEFTPSVIGTDGNFETAPVAIGLAQSPQAVLQTVGALPQNTGQLSMPHQSVGVAPNNFAPIQVAGGFQNPSAEVTSERYGNFGSIAVTSGLASSLSQADLKTTNSFAAINDSNSVNSTFLKSLLVNTNNSGDAIASSDIPVLSLQEVSPGPHMFKVPANALSQQNLNPTKSENAKALDTPAESFMQGIMGLFLPSSEVNDELYTAENTNLLLESPTVALKMECDEDALSSSQLNAYMKDLMAFVHASELAYRLPPPIPLQPANLSFFPTKNPSTDKTSATQSVDLNFVMQQDNAPIGNTTAAAPSAPMRVASDGTLPYSKIIGPGGSLIKQPATNASVSLGLPPPYRSPFHLLMPNASNIAALNKTAGFVTVKPPVQREVQLPLVQIPASNAQKVVHIPTSMTSSSISGGTATIQSNITPNIPLTVTSSQSTPTVLSAMPASSTLVTLSKFVELPGQSVKPVGTFSVSHLELSTSQRPAPQKIVEPKFLQLAQKPAVCLGADQKSADLPTAKESSSVSSGYVDILSECVSTILEDSNSSNSSSSTKEKRRVGPPDEAETTSAIEAIQKQMRDDEDSGEEAMEEDADDPAPTAGGVGDAGLLIVDVISAKEGAKDFYISNKIPDVLLDKSKKSAPEGIQEPSSNSGNEGEESDDSCDDDGPADDDNDSDEDSDIMEEVSKESVTSVKGNSMISKHLLPSASLFSLQNSYIIILCGKSSPTWDLLINTKALVPRTRADDAFKLRKKLRDELFVSCSAWWLIQRQYMCMIHPCSLCKNREFSIDRNRSYRDGFCWTCCNAACQKKYPIKRPSFFEQFRDVSLEHLLLLTYHWACQSNLEEIKEDVPLPPIKIWKYFTALQNLCNSAVAKKGQIGCPSTPGTKSSSLSGQVEVSFAKAGSNFILGALDRKTRFIRLGLISNSDAYHTTQHLFLLSQWVAKGATVITKNKMSDQHLLENYKVESHNVAMEDFRSSLPHVRNMERFLIKHLTDMFKNIKPDALMKPVFQGFLHELQWRVRFGNIVDTSFWSIFNQIKEMNEVVDPSIPTVVAKMGRLNFELIPNVNADYKKRWIDSEKLADYVLFPPGTFAPIKTYTRIVPAAAAESTPPVAVPPPSPSTAAPPPARLMELKGLLHNVPEVPSGSSYCNIAGVQKIRVTFDDGDSDLEKFAKDAAFLGKILRKQLFFDNPVKWLVKKSFIKHTSPCYVCQSPALLKDNIKFSDYCSWECQDSKCGFENEFRRPAFFRKFPNCSMQSVTAALYHWISQSPMSATVKDVPFSPPKIFQMYRRFQMVCSAAIKRDLKKLGTTGGTIELGVIRFGKMFVLGAFDRKKKVKVVKVFPAGMANQDTNLFQALRFWIAPKSSVVVNCSDRFWMGKDIHVLFADPSIVDKDSTGLHCLNITSYLLYHVCNMFGHLNAEFAKPDFLQLHLDELMWREKKGKTPQQLFLQFMYEVLYNFQDGSPLFLNAGDAIASNQGIPDLSSIQLLKMDLEEQSTEQKKEQRMEQKKELRVVLKRVPESLLRHYNCLPDVPPSVVTRRRHSSSEEDMSWSMGDSDSSESSDSSSSEKSNEDYSRTPNIPTLRRPPITLASKQQVQPVPVPKQKLQPLVIKRKQKTFTSYLKSPMKKPAMDTKNLIANHIRNQKLKSAKLKVPKKEPPDDSQEVNIVANLRVSDMTLKSPKKEPVDPQESTSQTLESVAEDSSCSSVFLRSTRVSPQQPNLRVPSTSGVGTGLSQPNLEGDECVECGQTINMNHFMKQYSCDDCKKSTYSTCCSSAFFEHRGHLLFGKRLTRATNKNRFGLHHPVTLPSSWQCACGFVTKYGNKLATHLVKCNKKTCFTVLKVL